MPHDRKDNEIRRGDIVSIPCRVREIYASEEACNVQLETIEHMPPYTEPTVITINTRQVDLVTHAAAT